MAPRQRAQKYLSPLITFLQRDQLLLTSLKLLLSRCLKQELTYMNACSKDRKIWVNEEVFIQASYDGSVLLQKHRLYKINKREWIVGPYFYMV